MKQIITVASIATMGACLAFSITGFADDSASGPAGKASIVGNYECKGTNFINNKKYDSRLKIVQTGQTYQFGWTSQDGKYSGTGLIGDDSSFVVVGFRKKNDPGFAGAQLYKISSDGTTFQGKWVIIGKNTIGSETCQKISHG